jgi:macrolide transport system ATP-binding/permease protein
VSEPLLRLTGVWREYGADDEHVIAALREVDLTIEAGEMVAIIGQSGSGKSTLMNILGCLDRPTRGAYRIDGRDTAALEPDELAALRRERFGFIFQRYHLLPDLDARGNVETPAVYAGWSRGQRRERALALLGRLGLGDRLHHRPTQLSGGQQQRVSIARALMNGGQIILADEPTGALDSASGAEMMAILEELNAEGHTVILVTHDAKVASHARRVIEIRDGQIIADRVNAKPAHAVEPKPVAPVRRPQSLLASLEGPGEALRMALLAMNAHRMRTFLTMLGIVIGIASVVSIVALGAGSQKAVLGEIATMGSNTITIYSGRDAGDVRTEGNRTLTSGDVQALTGQEYLDSVTPAVDAQGVLRRGNISAPAVINGVGEQYFRVRNVQLAQGRMFGSEAVTNYAQEAVIDDNTARKLFGARESPLGQVIIAGGVPFVVIGVTKAADNAIFAAGKDLTIWAPYTTVTARLLRAAQLSSVTVRMKDGVAPDVAQGAIDRLLSSRHGQTDFYMISSDSVRRTVERVTLLMSLLIGAIGGISLMVGGLGVMNIMLVSVSERTREIGVRTAIGARRSDIMAQFVIEAVLVCLMGGAIGVGLSLLIGAAFDRFAQGFEMVFSPGSIVAAFLTATVIGLVFGWLPARNAARLDPVEALARE